MRDSECERFLAEVLPALGFRPEGFARVRPIVRKRLNRRLRELGLVRAVDYQAYLQEHREERDVLAAMCLIPISRFYRDAGVFDCITNEILPQIARSALEQKRDAHVLSAGCASGEEPYSVAIAWLFGEIGAIASPELPKLSIVAIDKSPEMLTRAQRGCYPRGSFKELPRAWVEAATMVEQGGIRGGVDALCVRQSLFHGSKLNLTYCEADLRSSTFARATFDLVLARNAVFTYFDVDAQRAFLARIAEALRPGGFLVIGHKESLPSDCTELTLIDPKLRIFRRASDSALK